MLFATASLLTSFVILDTDYYSAFKRERQAKRVRNTFFALTSFALTLWLLGILDAYAELNWAIVGILVVASPFVPKFVIKLVVHIVTKVRQTTLFRNVKYYYTGESIEEISRLNEEAKAARLAEKEKKKRKKEENKDKEGAISIAEGF